MMKQDIPKGIWLVTDNGLYRQRALAQLVAEAAEAGVAAVELREPSLPPSERYHLARKLQKVLKGKHVPLLVQGDVALAQELQLDGVHLEAGDPDVAAARAALGELPLVGSSVSTLAELQEGHHPPADYLAVGPVHATASKAYTQAEWGVAATAEAFRTSKVPLVAAGGINAQTLAPLVAQGVDRVTVVKAVFAAQQPAQAVEGLSRIFLNP